MSSGVLETVREDDFIEYFLFPNLNNAKVDLENEDNVLESLLKEINSIADNYCRGYIWHKDSFKVTPRTSATNLLTEDDTTVKGPIPIHFHGVSHYGDNIQDEWFLVSLLLELTRKIKGLVARIVDADGEFILIEAAEHLPEWAKPEICEQRVYLFDGSVHLIPLKTTGSMKIKDIDEDSSDTENEQIINITDALKEFLINPKSTKANEAIQKSIQSRIMDFPDNIEKHLHRTTVYVPVAIAEILKKHPNLISAAVQAFCNRDSIDMKVCRAMKYFPPENRVYCSVQFTKCLYAMLIHNNYVPDRKIGWNMPPTHSSEYKSHILGVKIACGFEILVSQAKPSKDVEGDKAWGQYINSLKEKGYFQNLLENSQSYNQLLEKAKLYYIENRDSMRTTPTIGQDILNLIKTVDYNMEEDQTARSDLPPDDNENWLNISPDELDQMMMDRYGQKRTTLVANGNTDPTLLTGKLSDFLDKRSGFDGVECPSDDVELKFDAPVRPQRGVKSNKGKSKVSFDDKKSSENENKVNFDPDSFSCAVQNILDFMIPEENWQSSGSDMSDYEDEEFHKNLDDLQNGPEKKINLKQYMDQMDKELASTTIGQSFELKAGTSSGHKALDDSFDEVENFKPVDIDMNALKNIMESYQAQLGGSGPASNLLGQLGVRLEPDMDVE